jgi:hypothetical protein
MTQDIREKTLTKSSTTVAGSVSFWTKTICAHIVEYNSRKKESFHRGWPSEDDTKYHYEADLQAGRYDNGIAVRTGLLDHGPYFGQYLGCIDFDNEETFLTWCQGSENLDTLAKWTRVDWHNNPAKLHVFFISKTPLSNKRHNGIEVYSEKPNLICVYGIHRDGNRIVPYDTEKIAVVDDDKLLDIYNRIKSVFPDYDCHHDNTAAHNRILELEKSETVVGKGYVHNAMSSIMASYFLRYKGEWADMSDEERYQRAVDWEKEKAKQEGRLAYIDDNRRKLKKLWEDVKRKYGPKRQQERQERLIYDSTIGQRRRSG